MDTILKRFLASLINVQSELNLLEGVLDSEIGPSLLPNPQKQIEMRLLVARIHNQLEDMYKKLEEHEKEANASAFSFWHEKFNNKKPKAENINL